MVLSRFLPSRYKFLCTWPIFKGKQSKKNLLGLLYFRRWDRYVVPKRRWWNIILRWVKPQNSASLIYTVAETWNHANCIILTGHQRHNLIFPTWLINSKYRITPSTSSWKPTAKPFFALPVSRKTHKIAGTKEGPSWTDRCVDQQLPATIGLPRCAKLNCIQSFLNVSNFKLCTFSLA